MENHKYFSREKALNIEICSFLLLVGIYHVIVKFKTGVLGKLFVSNYNALNVYTSELL